MTRAEKVARAQKLRDEGLKLREIGERMGYSTSAVNGWLSDPDRSKEIARKDSYRGTCQECGRRTSGSNGRGAAPERCIHCCASVNDERNHKIEQLWEEGMPSWAIAEELGLREGQVRGCVQQGVADRTLKPHRLGGDADARERRREQLLAWRSEGLTNQEIGERIGTSMESVRQMFVVMRRRGIEVPNSVPRAATADPAALEELWAEGLTLSQIADFCGYACAGSVANRIWRLREKGHDFPPRSPGRGGGSIKGSAEQIIQLRSEGLTLAKVADTLGYSGPAAVCTRIRRLHEQGIVVPGYEPRAVAA